MVRICTLGAFLVASVFGRAIDVRADGPSLIVNEVRIHTFVTKTKGFSPSQRAALAAESLKAYDGPEALTKVAKGKALILKWGQKVVMTINPEEAKVLKVSPQTLAATVSQRIVDAASLPALVVDKTSLTLPPDKGLQVKLTGSGASKAKVLAAVPGVVSVTRSLGTLSLKPIKAGSTQLKIQFGESSIDVAVSVLPYALDPRVKIVAEVVGSPADESVVAGAVASALQAHASVPKGVRIWAKVLDAKSLMPGQFQSVKARVKATGAGYFPFEGEVTVKTNNSGEGVARDDALWYSNEPENIVKTGQLYWAKLGSGKSARLLFHHKNTTAMPVVVRYVVANPSDIPARLTIAVGEGRPDRNPTRAGYIAGDQFLSKWVSRSAEVLTVPPHSAVPLSIRRLATDETCSGLASIGLRAHGAPEVVVLGECLLPISLYDEWQSALNVNGAWHASRPRSLDTMRLKLDGIAQDVFADPFLEQTMDYEAGGRFGFARIGEHPLIDESKQRTLLGNFGVVYDIRGTLKNPTSAPVEVEVLFEASAGYGSGLFYINGDYVKLGLINPKQEIVLASIKLPPGVTKPLRIQTMPLSGANYPVTLIVRPIGFELQTSMKR